MTTPLSVPGTLVEVQPPETTLGAQQVTTLVRTHRIEVLRVIVPAGAHVPTHQAQGETIVHCLAGRAKLQGLGQVTELRAGQLLYLRVNEPFELTGIEDALLLVTIALPMRGHNVPLIG